MAKERIDGAVILMAVIRRPDGRRAATSASVLDPNSNEAAELLWAAVGRSKYRLEEIEALKSLRCLQPSAIPLLVLAAAQSPKLDRFVHDSKLEVPADAWINPILSQVIHLAPKEVLSPLITTIIGERPRVALSVIQRIRDRSAIKATWLETLWELIPDSRKTLIDLASFLGQTNRDAINALEWINRWLELANDTANDADEDEGEDYELYLPSSSGLWETWEEQIKTNSDAFDAIPTDWPGFSAAPEHFVERVCRYRCPPR